MGNINVTIGGVHKDVLEAFVTVGGVHKQVSSIFVTQNGVHKQVPMEKTLNNYTWEEISAISAAGQASHLFAVGDTKTENGFTAQIAGFNHDTITGSAGTTAGITFISQDLLVDPIQMSSSTSNPDGYVSTDMYNTHLPALFSTLSSELQAAIKKVTKLYYKVATSNYGAISVDLWLPSAQEMGQSGGTVIEGTIYELYSPAGVNAVRIKRRNGTTIANQYWLRTQVTNSSFARVTTTGGLSTLSPTDTTTRIPVAFCI